jgi:hypothetical protein
MHGQRFIFDQLSYLTRTFAFYIHREYQKILKLAKIKPHQTESLSDLKIKIVLQLIILCYSLPW